MRANVSSLSIIFLEGGQAVRRAFWLVVDCRRIQAILRQQEFRPSVEVLVVHLDSVLVLGTIAGIAGGPSGTSRYIVEADRILGLVGLCSFYSRLAVDPTLHLGRLEFPVVA